MPYFTFNIAFMRECFTLSKRRKENILSIIYATILGAPMQCVPLEKIKGFDRERIEKINPLTFTLTPISFSLPNTD